MADTYFLNGCAKDIRIFVNKGREYYLKALTLTGNPDQTAKLGLAASRSADQLGYGLNDVVILIEGEATHYLVELTEKVQIV